MVTVTERQMESISKHRGRIVAAVQVDRLFNAFEIEMTPEEALAFAEVAAPAGVSAVRNKLLPQSSLFPLIDRINATIPPVNFGIDHPQTGKPHHSFRIGRERGHRLLKVEIFKGFFQVDYDFMRLLGTIHAIGIEAGAQVIIAAGNNSYAIDMRWTGGDQ